jgi:hypothetical protein
MSWFRAAGPLSPEAAAPVNLEDCVLSSDRKFSITLSNTKAVLEDLGRFVISSMEAVGDEIVSAVVKNVATCVVNLVAAITSIVAERDSRNDAADYMPPVLPHQLVRFKAETSLALSNFRSNA